MPDTDTVVAPEAKAADAPGKSAQSPILPMSLRNMRPSMRPETVEMVADKLAAHHGLVEAPAEATPVPSPPPEKPPEVRLRPRRKAILNPAIEIPHDDEEIPFSSGLRLEVPRYVMRQVKEFCHQHEITANAFIMRLMEAHRDSDGKQVFVVRSGDTFPDRRKLAKPR